jgi:hypothetical protein
VEVPLGSRIPRRVCRANDRREIEVDIAEEAMRWMQGSAYSGPAQTDRGLQPYKGKLLHDEIRRLAALTLCSARLWRLRGGKYERHVALDRPTNVPVTQLPGAVLGSGALFAP